MRTQSRSLPRLLPLRSLSLLALGALLTSNAWAQCTIPVASDPNPVLAGLNLSSAISGASSGAVLCIDPGTYQGNFSIHGTNITLQPSGAAQSVILDGGNSGTVLSIQNVSSATQIQHLVIRNGNASGDGGGISIVDASPQVVGCRIEFNVAGNDGGGVHVLGATQASIPHFTACQIVSNSAGRNGGGMAFVGETGVLTTDTNSIITNTTLRLNTAGNSGFGLGGGIYAGIDFTTLIAPRLSIYRTRLNENMVTGSGGGVAARYGTVLVVDHSTVGFNAATDDGGGVWAADGIKLSVRSCYLPENQAGWQGGGIYVRRYDTGDIRHCVVDHNLLSDPSSLGGGIYISNTNGSYNGGNQPKGPGVDPQPGDPALFDVRNNLILGNASADGGGVTVEDATPLFAFNTLEGNVATVLATGGMLVNNVPPAGGFVVPLTIRNSIYWGNLGAIAPTNPWEVELYDIWGTSVVQFNDIRFTTGSALAALNIDADPLWTTGYTCPLSPIDGYFLSQPLPLSPCVDAGSGTLPAFLNGRVTNPAAATLPTPPSALDTGTADLGYHYPPATCP